MSAAPRPGDDAPRPRPRVVCLLPARNAAEDLPEYLQSAARFCDAIVALDDGSTDATGALLEACPLVKILLRNPRRADYRGWDDGANRNALLTAAAELQPVWIISIDADERLDPTDAAALRQFLEREARPECAYGLQFFGMHGDAAHYSPRFSWAYRLFAYAPGQSLPRRRLHAEPIPISIPRTAWVKTTLRIQHLGGLDRARRRARFEKYRQADPHCEYQADYTNLLREPPRPVPRWQPRPLDLPVQLATDSEPAAGATPAVEAPALSAIVISRDDEARIARTVASVVGQTCPEPFEVIVVTSGSDRTAEIVRRQFPQVALVELPRPALPGEARNAGLRLARGAYVTFPGSHVELLSGSLAARLRSHRLGHALVSGATLNGTRTWAGWASYFLDHWNHLPGQPPGVLRGPPGSCSYPRAALLEVGGFPENMRTAEDTAVNVALSGLGYVAYRDPAVRFIHHSPCRTPWRLVRHHFSRGRGDGRLDLEHQREEGRLLRRRGVGLLTSYPRGLVLITRNVLRWAPEYRGRYALAFPLVVLGALASCLGRWYELVRPGPGKAAVLFGRPSRTLLVVEVTGQRAAGISLMRLDLVGRRLRVVDLPCGLTVPNAEGSPERLDDALGLGLRGAAPGLSLDVVRAVIGRSFNLMVDDYAVVDQQRGLGCILDTSLRGLDRRLLVRQVGRLRPEAVAAGTPRTDQRRAEVEAGWSASGPEWARAGPFLHLRGPTETARGLAELAVFVRQHLDLADTAGPQPAASGPATIEWSTGDESMGQVWVASDGGAEELFAEGPCGSKAAPWLRSGFGYVVRLYHGAERRALLRSVSTTPGPTLRAEPNPTPSSTTAITWSTGDGSVGQVFVSDDGRAETLFAQGSEGSQEVTWIDPGSTYEFRLYAGTEHVTPLAAVTVRRGIRRWT